MPEPARVKAEHKHAEVAHAMSPITDMLLPLIDRDLAHLADKIMRASNDDDRRELAADMRALDRVRAKLRGIATRGLEAETRLAQWSTKQ